MPHIMNVSLIGSCFEKNQTFFKQKYCSTDGNELNPVVAIILLWYCPNCPSFMAYILHTLTCESFMNV